MLQQMPSPVSIRKLMSFSTPPSPSTSMPSPLPSTMTQSWGTGSLNRSLHSSSLLCLYLVQQPPLSVTLLLEPLAYSSLLPFNFRCIAPSTPCHTPVSVPLSSSSLRAWSGQGSTKMFGCGTEHVYSVSASRCIDIPSHAYQPLPALTFALTISTSILLDPSNPPEETHICSPALTASHVGLKPSLSQISQLRPLHEPSSLVGLLALVPLQQSPQTEDASLSLNSLLTSCSSLVPSTSTRPPITPSPMDW